VSRATSWIEADRLCDRIAIVDQGQLVALDTPSALKMNLPKTSIMDLSWETSRKITSKKSVNALRLAKLNMQVMVIRIHTSKCSRYSNRIFDLARTAGFSVDSINIQAQH